MEKLWNDLVNNFGFVAVVALIMGALFAVAKLAERFLPHFTPVKGTRRITIIAVCSAIAAILHIFDFPLPFLAPGFYKLDFSEIPVLLCGFYLGPSAGILCEVLKILLKLLLKGTTTAFVGDFANFAVGCSMILPALILYHAKKTKRTAIDGLILGTTIMTVFGSDFNALYLLPTFAKMFMPMESIIAAGHAVFPIVDSVWTLVLFCVAPLNLIKGISVSILTILLYKRVAKPLFGIHK